MDKHVSILLERLAKHFSEISALCNQIASIIQQNVEPELETAERDVKSEQCASLKKPLIDKIKEFESDLDIEPAGSQEDATNKRQQDNRNSLTQKSQAIRPAKDLLDYVLSIKQYIKKCEESLRR